MKKVLVFGTFDGLHPGHDYFLRAARALGDRLVVVVARDATVEFWKKRKPHLNEAQRHAELLRHASVSETVLGDEEMGTYEALKHHLPTCIVLGYDQHSLKVDLEARMEKGEVPIAELVVIEAYEPHLYKSSLLRPKS